jgi:hypothetical protein
MPGTYFGTVAEWLTARRLTAGIARLIHAPAAAADFPAGQRGALDGTTLWAEFIRFVTERGMTSGHDADPVFGRSGKSAAMRSRRAF